MSNRNFNKQTTNARQALAQGGPAKLGPKDDPRKRSGGPKMGRPSLGDKMKEQLIGSKEIRDKLRKKKSDMRKKQQADYMKKHGKNEPRRKTLSVKNTYKKEVEGLKK